MTLFIRIGLIALISLSHFGSVRGDTTIDAQFQAAVDQIGQVNRAESIEAFEDILSRDADYAPAYHALAKLYLQINTVNGRQRAMRMIQRAIALDPNNAVYRLMRGKIWWAQGFRFRALNQHENVNQKHPKNEEALDGAGMYWVYDFLALKDERPALWEYAQEAEREAERILRKSIQLDAMNQKPYYLLGVLYFADEEWEAFHALMQDLHAHYPTDKNVLLFCGLAEYQIGEYNESHEYYQRAYDLMSLEERELLESIDLLKPADAPVPRYAMAASDDGLARDVFWKSQDPLYLSDFNERKMEHFGRMAYSNLRFRRFSADVEGWQTDMGKTYIKFGRYRRRRSGYSVPCGASAQIGEIWFYETFKIVYCGDGGDRWSFGGGFAIGGGMPSESSAMSAATGGISYRDGGDQTDRSNMERMFSHGFPSVPSVIDEASHHTFRKTAQRFVDPYLNRKYTLPYQVAAFEERDSVRVELSYMIPKDRFKENAETGKVRFWDGVFLFDEQWQDVYNYRKSVTFALPPTKPAQNAGARHRNDHLLVSRMVSVPQGSYLLAVELLDQTSGAIGVARHREQFVSDSATFHLSDLLVGSDIQARHAFPEGRDDLIITPNPVRTFSQSEPVFIYLELYGLTRDTFGKTRYEIAYSIGKPEVDTLSPTLFASQSVIDTLGKTQIDLRKGSAQSSQMAPSQDGDRDIWGETKVYRSGGQVHHIAAEGLKINRSPDGDITRTVTADYEGDREMDFTYLQIDVAQVPAGIYQLTVSAKDKQTTGQTDRKYAYFRIAE